MPQPDWHGYLARIGYEGPLDPTLEVLRALCRAHVRSVPFELLDGPDGIKPEIDTQSVFEKVVVRRQGGSCMEVNNLFAALLTSLGYDVTTLAARPWLPQDRAYTETGDHMVLLVRLAGAEWLVDVAYSQLTAVEPLELDGTVRTERGWEFRVLRDGEAFVAQRKGLSGRWAPIHCFTRDPKGAEHFGEIVELYLNPANDSPILHTLMCSRVTPDGKVTLVNDLLIEASEGGAERSSRVETAHAFHQVMETVFAGHPQLAERGTRIRQRLMGDHPPAAPTTEETIV
ncbi:arylamine N-acetyltransferase family protein [Peterkaempfera bronchialis]|uniref:arylamine N-acetyltransferase family protein n=1 Tax=Peterkaempfera bronchialis TaxID=2126346 RepID=UPI003C2C8B65